MHNETHHLHGKYRISCSFFVQEQNLADTNFSAVESFSDEDFRNSSCDCSEHATKHGPNCIFSTHKNSSLIADKHMFTTQHNTFLVVVVKGTTQTPIIGVS